MSAKTTYEVGVRYIMDDKASKGLTAIGANAQRAATSTGSLAKALTMAAGAGGALYAGKKLLIDYNSEIDSMRIGMTAVLQLQFKKPFAEARKEAEGLFLNLREVAKTSPGTTREFIEMANAIAPAVAQMGGGVDKIQALAAGGVIAGHAFGERADVVALDIKQMLMGTVNAKDRIASMLTSAGGMSNEQFNAMKAGDRARFLEKMIQGPEIKKAAEEYGKSFQGQTAALQDMMQITFGEIGKPLVTEITKEFTKWNAWISKNPKLISEFARDFANALTKGFQTIKSVMGWIVDNKETIMTLVKTFAAFKLGQLAGGAIGDVIGNLSKFGTGLAGAGSMLGVFTGALVALVSYIDDVQTSNLKQATSVATVKGWGKDYLSGRLFGRDEKTAARQLMEVANKDGFIDQKTSVIDQAKIVKAATADSVWSNWGQGEIGARASRGQLTLDDARAIQANPKLLSDMYESNRDATQALAGILLAQEKSGLTVAKIQEEAARRQLEAAFYNMSNTDKVLSIWGMQGMAPKGADALQDGWKAGAKGGDVNVTINKIEVASDDPNRFVFDAVSAFEKVAKNPTQAKATITRGL